MREEGEFFGSGKIYATRLGYLKIILGERTSVFSPEPAAQDWRNEADEEGRKAGRQERINTMTRLGPSGVLAQFILSMRMWYQNIRKREQDDK